MFTPPPSPRPAQSKCAKTRSSPSSPLASPLPSPIPSPRTPRYLSPNFDDPHNDPLLHLSPPPSSSKSSLKSTIPPLPLPSSSSDSQLLKRRIGRRLKWAAIIVPLALVFITASTRWIVPSSSRPTFSVVSSFLGIFSSPSYTYTHVKSTCHLQIPPSLDTNSNVSLPAKISQSSPSVYQSTTREHKRRQNPSSPTSSPVAFPSTPATPTPSLPPSSASPTTVAATAQPLPTVPSTQPTNPPVPTPFPQPFDSELSTNFSSPTCYAFFQKMLNAPEFRTCRSFGLLLQSSDQFLKAQNNLTLLNTLVWGTCNTNTSSSQCDTNMASFADSLRQECSQDLKDENSRAIQTLTMLNAYTLMRTAGCQIDPSTNTYCFINAVHNTNPSDLYFYQLPIGTNFPRNSNPTCSACTRGLMGLYADALGKDARDLNGSGGKKLTGLRKTYDAAAQRAVNECGVGYATLHVVDSGAGRLGVAEDVRLTTLAVVVVGIVWFVSGGW